MAENEIVKTFSESLTDRLVSVKEALPQGTNITRLVQNAMVVLNSKPELQKCNKASLVNALMQSAYMGMDIGMGEGYVIAYGAEAQFQTSYIGEIKFVTRYSTKPISNIYAEVIRKNDIFERWSDNDGQHFKFTQNGIGADIIGAFAVCQFKDGAVQIEVMSTDEINKVRNSYSKARASKAWTNSWDEMAKKTVLRRLCKHISTNFETAEMREMWEKASGMEFDDNRPKYGEIVNPFAEPSKTQEEEPAPVMETTAKEVTSDGE